MLRALPGWLPGGRSANVALLGSVVAAFAVFGILLSLCLMTTLRPFGGLDFQRVVLLGQAKDGGDSGGISVSSSVEIQENARSLDAIARVQFTTLYLRTREGLEPVCVALVSPEFLTLFHAEIILGRGLGKYDEPWTDGPVGIVTEAYWRNRLGSDPNVLNRALPARDPGFSSVALVGVLSRGFRGFGFFTGRRVDLVLSQPVRRFEREGRNGLLVTALARLAPGVAMDAARREVGGIGAQLARQGSVYRGSSLTMRPASVLFSAVRQRLVLGTVATAIAFLLVLVCTAGVFQVRAVDRISEISIRQALGAGRRHIVLMLLGENLRFFLLTGLAGAFLAAIAIQWLGPVLADGIGLPSALDPRDARWLPFGMLVLTPLLAVLVAAAQIAMLVPAFRGGPPSTRSRWTPGRVALRRGLVVAQGAAAVGLAFTAVASINGLLAIERRSLGFQSSHILSARVTLRQQWSDNPSRWEKFFDSLVENLKRLPGVYSVGVMHSPLGEKIVPGTWTTVEPLSATSPGPILARDQIVHRSFFREMGIPAIAGRLCDAARPDDGPEIGVISEAMAERYWPHADPVGRHFQRGINGPLTIIGVVPSLRNSLLEDIAAPEVFLCAPLPQMYLMIRHANEWKGLESSLPPVARQLDPEAAIDEIVPLDEILDRTLRPARVLAGFLGILGGVAAAVAALALFAVAAMVIRQRRTELAIRIAVGADPLALGRRVEGEGLILAALGIVGGWLLYSWLFRYFAGLGARLYLPWHTAGASGIALLLLMWLAVKWPAYGLRRIDILSELKQE